MVSLSYFAGQVVPLEKLIDFATEFAFVALLLVAVAIGFPLWLESRKKEETPLPSVVTKEPETHNSAS
jgi:membrane-associated protein